MALAEVRRAAPDLVILDYRMGTPDGFTVCRAMKDDPRVAHVPVLILTGESRIEDRLGGFEAGADDYLAKPFDARELLARVTALLRQAQRALDRNPTTGLPGGVAIEREIDRRRADGQPFAVVYFDLDDFKPFADRFGFAVADEAIREAGRSIAATAEGRNDTFVGHVGGDDFVLVCPADDGRELARIARARFSPGAPAPPAQGRGARGRVHRRGPRRRGARVRPDAPFRRRHPRGPRAVDQPGAPRRARGRGQASRQVAGLRRHRRGGAVGGSVPRNLIAPADTRKPGPAGATFVCARFSAGALS